MGLCEGPEEIVEEMLDEMLEEILDEICRLLGPNRGKLVRLSHVAAAAHSSGRVYPAV